MRDDIHTYTQKLLRDRTAVPESIRFYRLDDAVTAGRQDEWLPVPASLEHFRKAKNTFGAMSCSELPLYGQV